MKVYLGIDIGGTAVKIGVMTEQGDLLREGEYPVNFDGYETPIFTTVLEKTRAFLTEEEAHAIEGIGVSATGQVDVKKGSIIGTAGHIRNYIGTEIKKGLESAFHKPVSVMNDANAVALGEQWIGAAKGCANAIVVTVGTGIGGGVIVDSKILNGALGIAGELGHFSIYGDGILCTCGNRGCLEQYASTTALVRRVRLRMKQSGASEQDLEALNGREIFQKLKEGNSEVEQETQAWMGDLAKGLISLTHIFNPEMILIGGGVSAQEELFVSKVRKLVLDGVMPRFAEGLKIQAAQLGNRAGIAGAVRNAMLEQTDQAETP